MPDYLVVVEQRRSVQFYVRGATREEAREAGDALTSEFAEWDDHDQNVDVTEVAIPTDPQHAVWAGGERGDWEVRP